jgi:glycerophosphoryl diester phosphodiesterase
MKQLFSTIVLFITLGLASLQATTRAEQLRSDLEKGSVNKVFVVAHRAAWKKAPENSRLSVEHAIDMGADIVEIDVRRTKDGVFVLTHDETIDRITNGKGNVSAFTYDARQARELPCPCVENSYSTISINA